MINSLNQIVREMRELESLGGVSVGSVLSFQYIFFNRDPYPMVLMLQDLGDSIFGINLKYLTLPTIQKLFNQLKDGSSYEEIKNSDRIRLAFRKYLKTGITNPRMAPLESILKMMVVSRTYLRDEVEAAQQRVGEQVNEGDTA